jgi:hypothetical protein
MWLMNYIQWSYLQVCYIDIKKETEEEDAEAWTHLLIGISRSAM